MRLPSAREELIQKYSAIINDHFKTAVKSQMLSDVQAVPQHTEEYLALAFEEYDAQVISVLREMISDWEGRMGDDADRTLYSLGLRRAIDELIGESSV